MGDSVLGRGPILEIPARPAERFRAEEKQQNRAGPSGHRSACWLSCSIPRLISTSTSPPIAMLMVTLMALLSSLLALRHGTLLGDAPESARKFLATLALLAGLVADIRRRSLRPGGLLARPARSKAPDYSLAQLPPWNGHSPSSQ